MFLAPIVEDSKPAKVTIPGKGTLNGLTILDGKTKKEKCSRFAAVRFAQPPIGDLRWRLPQPLPKDYNYDGDYTKFGTICPQPHYNNRPNQKHNPDDKYDEDCLFLNMWVPYGEPPENGWPVMIYYHGGFLQVGNPHQYTWADVQNLLAEPSPARFIVIAAGYRLNLFGFLSGKQLLEEDPMSSNFGFWDQRLALEWVEENISFFGGNRNNIGIGGVSAGSYSSIFQVAYEIYNPNVKQIIKRVQLISNGLAIQPKTIEESQEQFEQLAEAFGISRDLPSTEKLKRMRAIPFEKLADEILNLKLHTFRACTDDKFVSPTLFNDIYDGKFGEEFAKSGRSVIIGEVVNEFSIYANTNPPKTPEDFRNQLHNYYPAHVVEALLDLYPTVPEDLIKTDPASYMERTKKLFGTIVSDMQVYSSGRLFVNGLIKGGVPINRIFRYRVAYRAKFFDNIEPPASRVPHGGDMPIWFYTVANGILPEEKPFFIEWLTPVGDWIYGREVNWGTKNKQQIRYFNPDGSIEIKEDPYWDWAMKVGEVISKAVNN